MALIRGHHAFDEHFTQIPNAWVRDNRLSYRARGILVELLSHRSGWVVTLKSLAERNKEGKDAIRSAIHELEQFGYLKREQVRSGGKFQDSNWVTTDPPESDSPLSDFPTSVEPPLKKNIIKEHTFNEVEPVNRYSDDFETFWKNYPRRQQKGDAWKAWEQLRKKKLLPSVDVLTVAAENYGKRVTDPQFRKLPGGWLRAEMWLDEPEAPKRGEVKDADYSWSAAQDNIRRLKLEGKL